MIDIKSVDYNVFADITKILIPVLNEGLGERLRDFSSNLVKPKREIQHIAEYDYLKKECNREFNLDGTDNLKWRYGFITKIEPIISQEKFFLSEFLTEDGQVFCHPFSTKKGFNQNYFKLLDALYLNFDQEYHYQDLIGRTCCVTINEELNGGKIDYGLSYIGKRELHK